MFCKRIFSLKRYWSTRYYLISGKTLLILFWACLEGLLLLCSAAHYTADVYVGALIAFLTLTHDKIKYIGANV